MCFGLAKSRIPRCFCLGILVLVMIFLGNSRIPKKFLVIL